MKNTSSTYFNVVLCRAAGSLLYSQGKVLEAIECLKEAVEQKESIHSLLNLGMFYRPRLVSQARPLFPFYIGSGVPRPNIKRKKAVWPARLGHDHFVIVCCTSIVREDGTSHSELLYYHLRPRSKVKFGQHQIFSIVNGQATVISLINHSEIAAGDKM